MGIDSELRPTGALISADGEPTKNVEVKLDIKITEENGSKVLHATVILKRNEKNAGEGGKYADISVIITERNNTVELAKVDEAQRLVIKQDLSTDVKSELQAFGNKIILNWGSLVKIVEEEGNASSLQQVLFS